MHVILSVSSYIYNTAYVHKYISSSLPQYADDTVLYRPIRNLDDCKILQNDLNSVLDWCTDNKMELNSSKCKVMHITHSRREINVQYKLGEQPLEVVTALVRLFRDVSLHPVFHTTFPTHLHTNNVYSSLIYHLYIIASFI